MSKVNLSPSGRARMRTKMNLPYKGLKVAPTPLASSRNQVCCCTNLLCWYSPTVLKQWMSRPARLRSPMWICSRLWSEWLARMTCTATMLGWYKQGCLGKWYLADRPLPVMWWSSWWVFTGPNTEVVTWWRETKDRVDGEVWDFWTGKEDEECGRKRGEGGGECDQVVSRKTKSQEKGKGELNFEIMKG